MPNMLTVGATAEDERQWQANEALRSRVDPPVREPSLFEGSLRSAWTGVTSGAVKIGATVDAYFTDAFSRGADAAASLLPEPQAKGGKTDVLSQERAAQAMSQEGTLRALRNLTPDPATTGAAAQVIHGVGDMLSRAALGSAFGGTAGAAGAVGLSEEYTQRLTFEAQGVDPVTAQKAAAIGGLAGGLSVALPAAGSTWAKTFGLIAIGGPGGYMAEQAATREVLSGAGYDKLAVQHDPFDSTGLMVSLIGSGAFGVGAKLLRGADARLPAPEQGKLDAAMTLNEQHAVEAAYRGPEGDLQAANTHVAAVRQAAEQIAAGEPVSVHASLDDATARAASVEMAARIDEAAKSIPEPEAKAVKPKIKPKPAAATDAASVEPKPGQPAPDPVHSRAAEAVARQPDMMIEIDGQQMRAQDALAKIDEAAKAETADASLLDVAANCFLSH